MTPKEKVVDRRLRKHYVCVEGEPFSLDDYECVFAFQNRCCAICKKPRQPGQKRLAIDHDHKSGLLRGLLCYRCNKFVLGANDDIEKLRAVVEYLSKPPISVAFGRDRYTLPHRIGTKVRAKLLSQLGANVRPKSHSRSSRGIQKSIHRNSR